MMTMKSALITGAASGIGKACAERMAQEGYGVVVADVNLPAAEELAAKLAAGPLRHRRPHGCGR
ncbi:MAG: SDR family NAD(P)-dependent oxidoreductase [Dysosmobacter welbionis]